MADVELIRKALNNPLEGTDFPQLGEKYTGKVRDNYTTKDGRRYIITSDRISAFDRVLGTLPLKGQVLNWVTKFWFERTKDLVPNHIIATPDPNVMEVKECTPLKAEMVVRAYITGVTSTSIWTHYSQGKREFCGHKLPDGLKKDQRLEKPILTPSSKAPKGEHDQSRCRARSSSSTATSPPRTSIAAAEVVMKLFRLRHKSTAERTGPHPRRHEIRVGEGQADGNLCRHRRDPHPGLVALLVRQASYEERFAKGLAPESFDKEYVRRWLADQGFKGRGRGAHHSRRRQGGGHPSLHRGVRDASPARRSSPTSTSPSPG